MWSVFFSFSSSNVPTAKEFMPARLNRASLIPPSAIKHRRDIHKKKGSLLLPMRWKKKDPHVHLTSFQGFRGQVCGILHRENAFAFIYPGAFCVYPSINSATRHGYKGRTGGSFAAENVKPSPAQPFTNPINLIPIKTRIIMMSWCWLTDALTSWFICH